jgi:two-component system, OmpR family, phosphate regulon sensor histidine kinase PhoR
MLIKVNGLTYFRETKYFCCVKNLKNHLSLVLIVSSIVLLLLLQVFWIRSSYENEVADLRNECNTVFKNTIFQLRDSVFFSNIQPSMDSMAMIIRNEKISISNSKSLDSIFVGDRTKGVQVFMSSAIDNDSVLNLIKPFANKFKNDKNKSRNFTIRIEARTLNMDTLKKYFRKNLSQSNIQSPILVEEIKFSPFKFRGMLPPLPRNFAEPGEYQIPSITRSIFSDTLSTEPTRLNPGKWYLASLTDVRLTILKKITPQIIFSLFLLIVTSIAFIVLYKGLRAQQRLMELKNDFISNMTHELKTPVTTVGVAIEALKNFNGIENRELTQEYLTIAQNELGRLSLLTDKILKTAIFENKGVDFQPESVDLEKIIEQVKGSMKLLFEKNKAIVSVEKTGSDFKLQGSTVHLTNVVYNLLDNALKYSRENPEIKIKLKESGNNITLSVQDNGIGISSDHKKKIFEKFFRVPTGDVHNSKGYGLGLSYVDSVVKAHKGTIALESEINEGSIFIIQLSSKS